MGFVMDGLEAEAYDRSYSDRDLLRRIVGYFRPALPAMLFVAAKVSHLNLLPQGKAEKERRVLNMVRQMDAEGFGNCTVTGSCEAVCPKEISLSFIARMNRDSDTPGTEFKVAIAGPLVTLAIGIAYAATDELHQHFVRGRHASPVDVAIDAVGVALGMLVWLRVRQR